VGHIVKPPYPSLANGDGDGDGAASKRRRTSAGASSGINLHVLGTGYSDYLAHILSNVDAIVSGVGDRGRGAVSDGSDDGSATAIVYGAGLLYVSVDSGGDGGGNDITASDLTITKYTYKYDAYSALLPSSDDYDALYSERMDGVDKGGAKRAIAEMHRSYVGMIGKPAEPVLLATATTTTTTTTTAATNRFTLTPIPHLSNRATLHDGCCNYCNKRGFRCYSNYMKHCSVKHPNVVGNCGGIACDDGDAADNGDSDASSSDDAAEILHNLHTPYTQYTRPRKPTAPPPACYTLPISAAYLDEYYVIVVKPQGICTINGGDYSLAKCKGLERYGYKLYEYQKKWYDSPIVYTGVVKPDMPSTTLECTSECGSGINGSDKMTKPLPVHRLDTPTGGLVLCGRTHTSISSARVLFERHLIKKRYRSIVFGKVVGNGVIEDDVDGKKSKSLYKVVSNTLIANTEDSWITTLDLWPVTGRTHQLRKHVMKICNGMIGDYRYSKYYNDTNRFNSDGEKWCYNYEGSGIHDKLCLWAVELTFEHPFIQNCDGGNKEFCVCIDEPEEYERIRSTVGSVGLG
jgi:23S rRNA-/tRNA-specific pseudouridylate synthase